MGDSPICNRTSEARALHVPGMTAIEVFPERLRDCGVLAA